MLRTMDEHALATIPALHGLRTKMWRVVTMELRIPYFFVSHAFEEDGAWLHESCLLWRERDVVDLCQEVHRNIRRKISQLGVMLPGEAGQWTFEEIEEIWSSTSTDEDAAVFLSSDHRQLGRHATAPLPLTKLKQKIYARPTS